MRQTLPLRLAATVSLLLLAPTALRAATVVVHLGGSLGTSFSPQTVNIAVGDTVRWINDGGLHSVTADDGSFGQPATTAAFTFDHTFATAGTFGYYCNIHGFPGGGMFGTVVVGGAPPQAGTLQFNLVAYSVVESSGPAHITVQRVGGSDGAVAVQYSATAGTATNAQDFTATNGTLTWADGQGGTEGFDIAILGDGSAEGSETVLLALDTATGGAALNPDHDTAILTIIDDDVAPGGPPPSPPSALQASAQSTSSVALTWVDNANDETDFRIERRSVDGVYAQIATAPANATGATVTGLDPSTFYLFRVRAANGPSLSAPSNEANATTSGLLAPCVAGPQTLCINGGRFKAELDWHLADGTGGNGQAVPVPSAPDSGLFYFFGPANIEMLIKVLNACVPAFDRYWVFFAATTNVEFAVVVTDTRNGQTRAYYNPPDRSAPPVQDVNAFPTCP